MFTAKELRVLAPFVTEVTRECTFKELKASQNSNNSVQKSIRKMMGLRVLTSRKVGNMQLYSINAGSIAYPLLEMINHQLLSEPAKISIHLLRRELDKRTPFHTIVVFGSYSKGTQGKDSDLDIALIVPDHSIGKAIRKAAGFCPIKVHIHSFTPQDILSDAGRSSVLLKEIWRNGRPVYNSRIYYSIYASAARSK